MLAQSPHQPGRNPLVSWPSALYLWCTRCERVHLSSEWEECQGGCPTIYCGGRLVNAVPWTVGAWPVRRQGRWPLNPEDGAWYPHCGYSRYWSIGSVVLAHKRGCRGA